MIEWVFFTDGDKLMFFPAWMSAWSLSKGHKHGRQMPFRHTGIIMGTHSANGTRYYAKPSLVGRDHTQNEPRGSQWDQLRNREINPSKSLVSTNCYIFNWFVSFYHPGQLKQYCCLFHKSNVTFILLKNNCTHFHVASAIALRIRYSFDQ